MKTTFSFMVVVTVDQDAGQLVPRRDVRATITALLEGETIGYNDHRGDVKYAVIDQVEVD